MPNGMTGGVCETPSVTAYAVPPTNFGVIATGNHIYFEFAARSTTLSEGGKFFEGE